MTRPLFVTLNEVSHLVGDTAPVQGRCECRRGLLPLHTVNATSIWLRELLQIARDHGHAVPPPEQPFQTYRCIKCKKVAILTVGGLHLAP